MAKLKNFRVLIISTLLFLIFCHFSAIVYHPITFNLNLKSYNPMYTQGDTMTYVNYARSEIENRSFYEWFLKLNTNTASVVYFAWFYSLIGEFKIYDVYVTSLFFLASIAALYKLSTPHPKYLSFAILGSFSMIVYMQTFTKESLLSLFLILPLLAYKNKKPKLFLVTIILLALIRAYFSLILLSAVILHCIYKKIPRNYFYILAYVGLSSASILFTTIFTSFTINMNQSYGIYRYYLLSLPYYGLYLLWMPFKIMENLSEPIVAFYSKPIDGLIENISILFDSITSISILFLLFTIFRLRHKMKNAPEFSTFLCFFAGIYLAAIGILPLVHFRYLVPLVPVLGLLADQLNSVDCAPTNR